MEDPSFDFRVIIDHSDTDIDDFFIKYYPIRDEGTADLIRPSSNHQKKMVIMEILMVVYSILGFDKFIPLVNDYYPANNDDMTQFNNTFILGVLDDFNRYSNLSEKDKKYGYSWIKSLTVWQCSNFFCMHDDILRYSKNGINILKLLDINEEHYFDAINKLESLYHFYLNDISEEDKMSRHQYIPDGYYLDRIRSRRTKNARNHHNIR